MDAGHSDAGMSRAVLDGTAGDDLAGDSRALEDPAAEGRARGEVVVRDGVRVHLVPDDVLPSGMPFVDEPFDDAWYQDAVRAWETDQAAAQEPGPDTGTGPGPGWPPDFPPDVVPVVLWPQEVLRQALTGAPGQWLARVVAEAMDLAGNTADADVEADSIEAESGSLADLSDDALGDLMIACGRLQSWAAGIQARVVAERTTRETHPLAHSSLVGQVTSELVVTEPEATEVVIRAESGTQHPSVIAALTAGRIDVRKAHTLLRSAAQLTVTERAEAIRMFLPHAPRRTWKWLRARMLAFAKNRHGAAQTAKAEAQQRRVHLDRAENDMGWLSAYLPAPDAAAVWGVVDDMAHQLRHTTGEDRTLSQLRADSLTGIITGRLLPADRYTHPSTDTGTSTNTSTDAGAGAKTETGSRTDSGTETGTRASGIDGSSTEVGETAVDLSGNRTGATGIGTELGDTVPSDAQMPGDVEAPGNAGTPDGDVPVCTCGGKAPIQHVIVEEIVRPVRVTPTRPVIRVTIPATALLGLDDAPGHLHGYGPIPADTAAAIAQDATWQRLLTDPVTGILTDYSTTTYQPGIVLRAAVEARDDTCMFDWCDTPASRCDLDHIHPFDHDRTGTGNAPGQTRAHNLQPLCRRHHLLKTHAGWGVVRDPHTGITTWTTPTGRTHTRPPTVLDTHIDLDHIDPDTSSDLTLHALTGQHLPRPYQTTEPGAIPSNPDEQPADPSDPPF